MPDDPEDIAVHPPDAAEADRREPSAAIDFHIIGHIWMAQRLLAAGRDLSHLVTVDPEVRKGAPVLAGTRFPVSRLLAEMAEDRPLSEVAHDHELEPEKLSQFLHALAALLDRPTGG